MLWLNRHPLRHLLLESAHYKEQGTLVAFPVKPCEVTTYNVA